MLKKGDTIVCSDTEDLKKTLRDLGAARINAVVWDYKRHIIMINRVPGEE